jgi:hypothetical protein
MGAKRKKTWPAVLGMTSVFSDLNCVLWTIDFYVARYIMGAGINASAVNLFASR